MKVLLTLSGGFESSRSATLERDGEYTFGRAMDATIPIMDPRISRLHFSIVLDGDGLRCRDLNSTNGTLVDGVRIGGGPTAGGNIEPASRGGTQATLHTRSDALTAPPVSGETEAPLREGSKIEVGSTLVLVSIQVGEEDHATLLRWVDQGDEKLEEAARLYERALGLDPNNGRLREKFLTLENLVNRWGRRNRPEG